MEPVVRHIDIRGGVFPGKRQFAISKMAVAREIHVTEGAIGLAQDVANIFEIEVAAIAKCRVNPNS